MCHKRNNGNKASMKIRPFNSFRKCRIMQLNLNDAVIYAAYFDIKNYGLTKIDLGASYWGLQRSN